MAESGSSIFNEKAREKLRSPDDLDKYVRVTSPSVLVALAACAALLFGILVWGVFGTVSRNVVGTGVLKDGSVSCFVSAGDAARVHQGDAALVNGEKLQVASVASIPLSREEAAQRLESDYLVESLFDGDWATEVTFEGDVSSLAEGVPLSVNITTERVAPITLILGE